MLYCIALFGWLVYNPMPFRTESTAKGMRVRIFESGGLYISREAKLLLGSTSICVSVCRERVRESEECRVVYINDLVYKFVCVNITI